MEWLERTLRQKTYPLYSAVAKNLERHLENIAKYGVPAVVAINRFTTDSDVEVQIVKERCQNVGH